MNTLVDINGNPADIIQKFRALHNDLDEFIGKRPDSLPIGNILLIKFIVICYDKNSEITRKYSTNWAEKKKEAALAAGLKTNEQWEDAVSNLLFGNIESINNVIIRYLSLQFDTEFTEYAVLSEMLIKQNQELINFKYSKPSDATKAKQNAKELSVEIEELKQKIFSGGDVKKLQKALDQHILKFTIKDLRPENVVTKKDNGEKIIDEEPYGDYEIEKMKFVGDE